MGAKIYLWLGKGCNKDEKFKVCILEIYTCLVYIQLYVLKVTLKWQLLYDELKFAVNSFKLNFSPLSKIKKKMFLSVELNLEF